MPLDPMQEMIMRELLAGGYMEKFGGMPGVNGLEQYYPPPVMNRGMPAFAGIPEQGGFNLYPKFDIPLEFFGPGYGGPGTPKQDGYNVRGRPQQGDLGYSRHFTTPLTHYRARPTGAPGGGGSQGFEGPGRRFEGPSRGFEGRGSPRPRKQIRGDTASPYIGFNL